MTCHNNLSLPHIPMITIATLMTAALVTFAPPVAHAWQPRGFINQVESALGSAIESGSTVVPATGQIEYAFSPRAGAEALVLKVIRSSRRDLRMMAYSFTSASITKALLDAKHRGVDVRLVVDYKQNVQADRSGKARAGLSALANAGIPVRTVDSFSIFHDKVAIADSATVQTGSFNYTQAAAKSNSENVIVMWNNPQLANGYLAHWESRWRMGRPFAASY